MAGRLEGKVCIITGTGGSMGRAAALLFAREGASVVGCDIDPQSGQQVLDEVAAAGGAMVSLHPCNLTIPDQCQALVDLAVETYGRIDVLYNNAAMAYFGWIEQLSNEDWYNTINEEVHLVFLLTKAAWPELAKQGGVIINIASGVGHQPVRVLPAIAHSTAKGAVLSMTRHLAMEGRLHGIRANSLSPGIIETKQTRPLLDDPEWSRAVIGEVMMNRAGRPEEIASAALFLASDDASYVTGIDLAVDGGMRSW